MTPIERFADLVEWAVAAVVAGAIWAAILEVVWVAYGALA